MADAATSVQEQQVSNCNVPTLGAVDQARSQVLASPVNKGPIICRPKAVGLAEKFDGDAACVSEMQRVRSQPGVAPVQMRGVPGRKVAPLLDPADVHRVLNNPPVRCTGGHAMTSMSDGE